jgi:hypothetical protein
MGKGIGQQVQDQWLVYVHPAMAGWTNPFSMPDRKKAVWYDKGGHFVYEGEMKLPSGAIVMELPPLQTFEGPAGCKVRSSVEKIEKDGGIYLKSRLDFDRPYIVSKADYSAWMAYETNLAKASQQRCIITLPAKPELE